MRVMLFGAAPDTGNLGVSALSATVVHGLLQRIPDLDLIVQDHGRGRRAVEMPCGAQGTRLSRCGLRATRRVHQPGALANVRWRLRARLRNSVESKVIEDCDVILDISGGDSFTDLYGKKRFQAVNLPKIIALENDIPLVMLPQTYGPFQARSHRRLATRLVQGASACWARDARSFDTLKGLLGGDFDACRHRLGVDVAFLLEPRSAVPAGFGGRQQWPDATCVGVNVSGLLWSDRGTGHNAFGLKADYRRVILGLLKRLLAEDVNVILIPHVITPADHSESDVDACNAIVKGVEGQLGGGGRLEVAPASRYPQEAKWWISRCDWFCGTRMHATIAALSSGVPTTALSYSNKTLGVFETCGQGAQVVDPRELDTDEAIDALWRAFHEREQQRGSLAEHLPGVMNTARTQMDAIARACMEAGGQNNCQGAL